MRSPGLLVAAVVLSYVATACSEDGPAGTIAEGDLPGDPEVAEVVLGDDQAGQVVCSDVNDAEDMHVLTAAVTDDEDEDEPPVVTYELAGSNHERISDSVWWLSNPTDAVAAVAEGLRACVEANPDLYEEFTVDGHDGALGYVAQEGAPTATFTRRILVPLSDRVVIVTATRDGDDDFTVAPDEVLDRAVEVSGDAPKA